MCLDPSVGCCGIAWWLADIVTLHSVAAAERCKPPLTLRHLMLLMYNCRIESVDNAMDMAASPPREQSFLEQLAGAHPYAIPQAS